MRRHGTITALLFALIGILIALTGAEVTDGFEPGLPAPVGAASAPAGRPESEKELPPGISVRHTSHSTVRTDPDGCAAPRPAGPCHTPAEPVLPPCTPRTGPDVPPSYPSRTTGGATASVFQVFRC